MVELNEDESTPQDGFFFFRKFIDIKAEQFKGDFSVIIDSNYLLQFNKEDLFHLFFDSTYQKRIANPLKKQMAMLIVCRNQAKLTIFVSNQIFREFVKIAPDKMDLLPYYKKYFAAIGSKRDNESYFLDLSNLLTLRANSNGFKADSSDTYSFIIASLANIEYFISEDNDLKGIFQYFTHFRKGDQATLKKEVDIVVKMSEELFDVKQEIFPIRKIVESLFKTGFLTCPVSLKDVTKDLPEINEKTNVVTNFCNIINQILSCKNKSILEDRTKILDKALNLVADISRQMGINLPKNQDLIDVPEFLMMLIEKECLWKLPEDIRKTETKLLNLLDNIYKKEEESSGDTWEEIFSNSVPDLEIEAKCDCGHEFSESIFYEGIVSSDERAMGDELLHVWNNSFKCPECNKEITVELSVWEYPEGLLNAADFSESDCEVLNKEQISTKIRIDIG